MNVPLFHRCLAIIEPYIGDGQELVSLAASLAEVMTGPNDKFNVAVRDGRTDEYIIIGGDRSDGRYIIDFSFQDSVEGKV